MAHSILSPSNADRWMVCHGAVAATHGMLEAQPSKYAAEGTAAHELAAWCLTEKRRPTERLGDVIEVVEETANGPFRFNITITVEMVEAVEVYIDNMVHYRTPGDTIFVEQGLPVGWYSDRLRDAMGVNDGSEDQGTGDCVLITGDGEEVQAHDLKYGKGIVVDSRNNRQLLIYVLSILRKFSMVMEDVKRVRLVIHQPRVSKKPSEWSVTLEEALAFEQEVIAAAEANVRAFQRYEDTGATEAWEAEFLHPEEDACQWCQKKTDCNARMQWVADQVGNDFNPIGDPENAVPAIEGAIADVSKHSNEKLAAWLPVLDHLTKFAKEIREEAHNRAVKRGEHIPGYKVVEGSLGDRAWGDPDKVEEILKKQFRLKDADVYKMSLHTPPQIEKLLKRESPKRWNKLQEHIVRAKGGLKLVPETAKGDPVKVDPQDGFTDLDDQDAAEQAGVV